MGNRSIGEKLMFRLWQEERDHGNCYADLAVTNKVVLIIGLLLFSIWYVAVHKFLVLLPRLYNDPFPVIFVFCWLPTPQLYPPGLVFC